MLVFKAAFCLSKYICQIDIFTYPEYTSMAIDMDIYTDFTEKHKEARIIHRQNMLMFLWPASFQHLKNIYILIIYYFPTIF